MGLRAAAYVWMGMCISTVAAIRIPDRFSQLLRNMCTQTEAHSGELISTSVMMLLALFHKKLILNFQNQESSYTGSPLMFTHKTMAPWLHLEPLNPDSYWISMAHGVMAICVPWWHQKTKATYLSYRFRHALCFSGVSWEPPEDRWNTGSKICRKGIFWHWSLISYRCSVFFCTCIHNLRTGIMESNDTDAG